MRRALRSGLLTVLALATSVSGEWGEALAFAKPPKKDTQCNLTRPADGPDANAKGTVRLRTDDKKDRHRFDLVGKNLDELVPLDLYIETGVATDLYDLVGTLDADGSEQSWRVDTKKGDALPGGALSNEDLIGRRLELRDGAEVVLKATLPPFGLSKKKIDRKDKLDLPGGAPDPDAMGEVRVRTRPLKGDERFEVKVKKLDFDASTFHVFMEDAVGSGIFVGVGELSRLGTSDKGRLRLRAKDGQSLPFDVPFASDLSGRALQVRDGLDGKYLEGVVPDLSP